MDNLDRMFRHLVRTIRSRFPQYLSQPFDVSELYQTILPYRLNRRELALESNEDYEITLTELLSGAGDYLIVEQAMRDALRTELASVDPDPSACKQFAGARVAISPAALRSLSVGPVDDSMPPLTAATPIAPATVERPAQPAPPPRAPSAPPPPLATTTPKPPRPSAPIQS